MHFKATNKQKMYKAIISLKLLAYGFECSSFVILGNSVNRCHIIIVFSLQGIENKWKRKIVTAINTSNNQAVVGMQCI